MRFSFILMAICCGTYMLQAQTRIPLYNGLAPNSKPVAGLRDSSIFFMSGKDSIHFVIQVAAPDLTAYFPQKAKSGNSAVIICPGGGYTGLAVGHEGHAIARRLQAEGIAAFVLKYRLPSPSLVDNKTIVPLQDAQRAIQLVRENALQWGINPQKIGIMGSSAGGHLASTAGTHWQTAQIPNPNNTSLRPDFMILNYPVISMADSLTHYGSRFNLIGPIIAPEEFKRISSDWRNSEEGWKKIPIAPEPKILYSNELQVNAQTPPTFITSATDDDVVKVQNSLLFVSALQRNGVPVSSFFYANGGHGYGMDNPTSATDWMPACLDWLRGRNELSTAQETIDKQQNKLKRMENDWPNMAKYAADNAKIPAPKRKEHRVVLMGNSITEGWAAQNPAFFSRNACIGRGISGQTTPQMLLRFRQDVLDLKPKVVVICAGINDVAENTGPYNQEVTMSNIMSMAELAKANKIKVILASVHPASAFPWRPEITNVAGKIMALNAAIQAYCEKKNILYLDYHSAMKNAENGMSPDLAADGVHPTPAGYKIMESLLTKALAKTLKRK